MSEFFYGWSRKIGTITLVMACFVMGMWIRSRAINDAIAFPGQQRQHVLFSGKGCVHWLAYSLGGQQPEWDAHTNVESEFLFFARMGSDSVEARFGEWTIPYWLLVVPLALLSASLILWKPSKRDADSTPSEVSTPK